jgi:site-specific DNA-methyltransferase (adenine-specific)
MMAVRLLELHRALKPTGSLYLHCDPTASHYLKLVLDAIFGQENFRSEIIWRRTSSHNKLTWQFGPVHDTIFFYSKSRHATFHPGRTPHLSQYISGAFRYSDDRGVYRLNELTGAGIRTGPSGAPWMGYDPSSRSRHWAIPASLRDQLPVDQRSGPPQQILDLLLESGEIVLSASGRPTYKQRLGEGTLYQDIWAYQPGTEGCLTGTSAGIDADVKWLDSEEEKLGYPTQKPVGLLERIIAASSNPGDVVLDPFCGCGTAVDAAQKLGRRWVGIDITHLAIGLIEKRMREGYGEAARFETIGSPRDLASAQRLAQDDPHQFQHWITLRLGGWPWMGGKKGGDKGVDGYFYYVGASGRTETGVISVKAGHNVNPGMVRDLGRVMQRDGHKIGLFICAVAPTRGMEQEADSHGLIETEFGRFPALQLFTLAELFQDRSPRLPPLVSPNRKAPRVEVRVSHQPGAQAGLDFS